jgi:hypothetical protein
MTGSCGGGGGSGSNKVDVIIYIYQVALGFRTWTQDINGDIQKDRRV